MSAAFRDVSRLALASLLACAATSVHAQEAVDELLVTGEKAERTVQETVTSAAVISAERIENETAEWLQDLYGRVANFTPHRGRYGFNIRGIGNQDVSGAGMGALASVYVDGAVLPEHGAESGPLELWDIGQVEVLRGPQSTIQGRNALAGAVVIRSKDPTQNFEGRARLILGEYGQRTYAAAVSGPLVPEELAGRLAVQLRETDGFVSNPLRGERTQGEEVESWRGKLLWTPRALPDLRVLATYSRNEARFGDDLSRTDTPDYWEKRVSLNDAPIRQTTQSEIFTLEAQQSLGEGLTLTGVASWNKVDYRFLRDLDRGPAPSAYSDWREDTATASQELRLNFERDRWEGLLGLYHAKLDIDFVVNSRTEIPTPTATLAGVLIQTFRLPPATANAAALAYTQALPVVPVDSFQDTPVEIENYALFADGSYRLTDNLSLLAGFRYDREENIQTVTQRTTFAGVYPNPARFGALAPVIGGLNQVVAAFVAQATGATPPTGREFDAFLPKLGLRYAFTDDMSAAFVVQRAYRSGGTVQNLARASVVPYDPEYTTNYELAFRSAWRDGRLTLNANAFYIDWEDQQVYVNLGLNTYDAQIENAGGSHLYGFEIELNHAPREGLTYYASLGHTRTEFEDFRITTGALTVDLAGAEFAFAPRWNAAVGLDWRFAYDLALNLNANWRSAAYRNLGLAAQTDRDVDARTVVNAKFGYDGPRWSAQVFAHNLFDEAWSENGPYDAFHATLSPPRVIGAVLEAKF